MPATQHDDHVKHALPTLAAVGGVAAVSFAPLLLPLIGIGKSEAATEVLAALHGNEAGTGLAGIANGLLGSIPGVGGILGVGGIGSALLIGGVGIGGVLLANWMEKNETGQESIRWSRVIRTVAITTSILMALPAILTGVSVGLAFLATVVGGAAAGSAAVTGLIGTLGTVGAFSASTVGSGLAISALPHLITCGFALAPALGAVLLGSQKAPEATVSSAQHLDRLKAMPPQDLAHPHAHSR